MIPHLPKRIKGAESDDVNCAPGALYGLRHPSRVDGSSKKVTGKRVMLLSTAFDALDDSHN